MRKLGEVLRKDLECKLAASKRAHQKEITDIKVAAQEMLKQHEADTVARLCAQDDETRPEKHRIAAEREEWKAEAAELAEQVEQLQAQLEQLRVALERVREMSKGALLEQACAQPHHTIPYHTTPYHTIPIPHHTTPYHTTPCM